MTEVVERKVPPLPGIKPPVPLDFKLRQLFSGAGSMIPSLTLQGGDAGPATSGGIGTQGNIGALNFGDAVFKSGPKITTLIFIGIAGFIAWRFLGKK